MPGDCDTSCNEGDNNAAKLMFYLQTTLNTFNMGLIRTIKKVAPGGLEKGEEEGQELQKKKLVLSLILQLGMSDEQASEVAQVSLSFVKEIRAELKGNK
jgi:hypothetical protein